LYQGNILFTAFIDDNLLAGADLKEIENVVKEIKSKTQKSITFAVEAIFQNF
jgi:tRNA(Ser,Leu) C12 N-acetylase TAN1